MAELREREDAVSQGQVWVTGSNNFGGAGVQRKEVRISGPGLQGGAKATIPTWDATRVWILSSLMTCALNKLRKGFSSHKKQ